MTKIVEETVSSALGEEKGSSALSKRNSFMRMFSMISMNISMDQFVVTAGGFFPLSRDLSQALPTSLLSKSEISVFSNTVNEMSLSRC